MKTTIKDDELYVQFNFFETIFALKHSLKIPLKTISEVSTKSTDIAFKRIVSGAFFRLPGVYIPGVIRAGSYYGAKQWEFWSVRRNQTVVALSLTHGVYKYVYLGFSSENDARNLVQELNKAKS